MWPKLDCAFLVVDRSPGSVLHSLSVKEWQKTAKCLQKHNTKKITQEFLFVFFMAWRKVPPCLPLSLSLSVCLSVCVIAMLHFVWLHLFHTKKQKNSTLGHPFCGNHANTRKVISRISGGSEGLLYGISRAKSITLCVFRWCTQSQVLHLKPNLIRLWLLISPTVLDATGGTASDSTQYHHYVAT